VETLEVLSDPDLTAALPSSLEDLSHGRLLAHESAKKHLGVRRMRPRKLLRQRRLTR
jgi:hypothetical protein